MNSKVSVIMNCFNGEAYLSQAIDSVFKQSYTDFEIIFFDNASTDSSAEIAKNYGPKLHYYYSQNLIPLGKARKEAMTHANGGWIAILDVDDFWLPNHLETSLNSIRETEYVMSYSGIKEINKKGKTIRLIRPIHKSGMQLKQQLRHYEINMQTPVISKEFLDQHKIEFNEEMHVSEDFNFFVRIAARGKIKVINKVTAAYRVHDSLTNKNIEYWYLDHRNTLEQLKKENHSLYESNFEDIKLAKAKAEYYLARFHFSQKEYRLTREIMGKLKEISLIYFILWLISFSPFLWNLVHSDLIKRGTSKIVGRIMQR